ncbi:MAG: hypothetical protein H6Q66_1471 [Firmicutes bacterium]|nr:hypothetical protein [Bacillota bacterium]
MCENDIYAKKTWQKIEYLYISNCLEDISLKAVFHL